MSSVWTQHIPEGTTLEQCERQHVNSLGGPPPIHIVCKATKGDNEKVDTVTIKLNGGKNTLCPSFVVAWRKKRFVSSIPARLLLFIDNDVKYMI